MYSEMVLKFLYKTINESISCNVSNIFTQRALKGKLGTHRALEGHSRHFRTWVFEAFEHFKGN